MQKHVHTRANPIIGMCGHSNCNPPIFRGSEWVRICILCCSNAKQKNVRSTRNSSVNQRVNRYIKHQCEYVSASLDWRVTVLCARSTKLWQSSTPASTPSGATTLTVSTGRIPARSVYLLQSINMANAFGNKLRTYNIYGTSQSSQAGAETWSRSSVDGDGTQARSWERRNG